MTQVSLEQLVSRAIAGEVVSFPTDTVPALAVRPEKAARIFALKERSHTKPLILMGASWLDLLPYIGGTPQEREIWQQVGEKYFPGALTLVLPASSLLPPEINPLDPTTIGIRIPNQPLAQSILAQTKPLATTSANLSGKPPLLTAADIELAFPSVFILNQPDLQRKENFGSGLPSTVAKWTGEGWHILRQGSVELK